jgi:TonB family protein
VEYTAAARAAGLQGSIYLYVQVEPDGSTSHIQVLHGLGLGLDEKAVEAVKQWHYSPAMAGGKPVSMGHSAEVEFRLEKNSEWRILMASYTMPGYGPVRGDEPKLVQYKAFQFGECQAGATGWVEFNIRSDGTPDWVTTDSGSAFREAAAKAIADWRYKPGRQDGRDLETRAMVEFECGPRPVDELGAGIGTATTRPSVTFRADPRYSAEAWDARFNGTVRLSVMVDERGVPKDISVVTPLGMGLDERAVAAVQQWRFKPGLKYGKPAAVRVVIDIAFRVL